MIASQYIETFFIQLSVVFAADESRFSSDEMKVLYTIGCLSGNALSYVQPFLKNIDSNNPNDKHEILKDFNIFKKFLFDAFGDSNLVVNSENAIRNLKQTGSATRYATEFRRLSMQLTWNNDALVSQYVLNLKNQIKDELARIDPILDLNAIINKSIDIDNRMFARAQDRINNRQPSHPSTATPMDLNAIQQAPLPVTPINNSANITNVCRGPITDEEKQRRRNLNLCLYCGMSGHFTAACPNKRPSQHLTPQEYHLSTIILDEDNYDHQQQQIVPYHQHHQINSITRIEDPQINLISHNRMKESDHATVRQEYQEATKKRAASMEKCSDLNIRYVTGTERPGGIMLIPITLSLKHKNMKVFALVDSGSSTSFISSKLIQEENLPYNFSPDPISFRLADNSIKTTTRNTTLVMALDFTDHQEVIRLHHLDHAAHDVILGQDWLISHNPAFDWRGGIMALTCLFRNCLATTVPKPIDVVTIDDDEEHLHEVLNNIKEIEKGYTCNTPILVDDDDNPLRPPGNNHFPLNNEHHIHLGYGSSEYLPAHLPHFSRCFSPATYNKVNDVFNCYSRRLCNMNDLFNKKMYSKRAFSNPLLFPFTNSTICSSITANPPKTTFKTHAPVAPVKLSQPEPEKEDPKPNRSDHPEYLALKAPENDETKSDNIETTPKSEIPEKYRDFEIIFSKQEADKLPPDRPYDHTIPLKPGSELVSGPLYNLSKVELDTLYAYIQENLAKGFIERSESPIGAPIFFVKKK